MYRSQRNYENLEKRLFNVPGKYGIPVIEPTHLKRKIDFIPFNYCLLYTSAMVYDIIKSLVSV